LTSVARRAAGLTSSDGQPTPIQVGLLIAAAMIVLDQATKELAERLLDRSAFVSLIGDAIGWQLVYNPGGAFGLPAPSWLFIIVTVAVTVIVARTLPHTRSLLQASAYGLLLAGALGNAVDRVLRSSTTGRDGWFDGEVVDFVAWGAFPRFNVADSAITVGFALLVVALWQEERHGSEAEGRATSTNVTSGEAAAEADAAARHADPSHADASHAPSDVDASGADAAQERS
jgi:signal peptidase II